MRRNLVTWFPTFDANALGDKLRGRVPLIPLATWGARCQVIK